MIDLNHVSLIGRLTRDAEYKVLPSGQAVCNFSIAVNRRRKNGDSWEDEANYFDIVLWGKQADSLNRYLVKGKQIGVDGELRQDRWQQDGQNRSKVVISAVNVQLLGGGPGQGGVGTYSGSQSGGYSPAPGGVYQPSGGGGNQYGETGDMNGGARNVPSDNQFTDDIPF
ncbi:MAG: single-stranded DNA-binding protein [Spirochaetaceae bacterium]|jgi:single-strand DNA-binding protein|nr:single-stranded DNA-binding protein [Spirochaetaceae bacterium]